MAPHWQPPLSTGEAFVMMLLLPTHAGTLERRLPQVARLFLMAPMSAAHASRAPAWLPMSAADAGRAPLG